MSYTDHANGAFLKRAGNYSIGKQVLDEIITLERYIDCSVDKLDSGCFYKLWAVPDDFAVLEAYVTNDVAEGASDTIDIVDDDSATTTFVTNANLNSAGTVTATNARKVYQAAGFICMRPDAALTAAKFWVVIVGKVLDKNS